VTTTGTRRSYDSSRRRAMAADNRAAVHAAAAELFATRGWAVGMRDIAKAAGVSVETVYTTAGGKGDLLTRVIDIGVVGDDEPLPLSDRPEFRALGEGTRRERVEAASRVIADSNRRAAALNRTLAQAAAGDPALAEKWRANQATERQQYVEGVRLLLGRRARRDVVDGLWALGSSEVYLQLTTPTDRGGAGWGHRKYRHWLAERIAQLLPEETR
jgi:AcrR family transcriptional regulator